MIDYLTAARSAHQRNDWRASYSAFVRADAVGPMPTDDLDAFSAAAWRARPRSLRLSGWPSAPTTGSVRTDPAAAAMKAAELWR